MPPELDLWDLWEILNDIVLPSNPSEGGADLTTRTNLIHNALLGLWQIMFGLHLEEHSIISPVGMVPNNSAVSQRIEKFY